MAVRVGQGSANTTTEKPVYFISHTHSIPSLCTLERDKERAGKETVCESIFIHSAFHQHRRLKCICVPFPCTLCRVFEEKCHRRRDRLRLRVNSLSVRAADFPRIFTARITSVWLPIFSAYFKRKLFMCFWVSKAERVYGSGGRWKADFICALLFSLWGIEFIALV